ncbi:site-specific integrase [Maridesulfovibrio sp.]|uniref:tyrosine-type recombinase/integrase n=1 Tax=Maridesulfovibrio sp. TaxID=2795000 RepID=UPI002AA8D18E|nr:site-specific integrase [Maridesulfovibrio sp.]
MSTHQRKNGTWFVRYRENGKQVNHTCGKGEAGRLEAERLDAEIKAKKDLAKTEVLVFPEDQKKIEYFDDLAVQYFDDVAADGWKQWRKDWSVLLDNNLTEELSQIPISRLTQSFIVNLLKKKFKEASPRTRGKYARYLKTMFKWAEERGLIDKNPLQFLKGKKYPKKPLNIDMETIKLIKAEASEHLAFAIDILCNTGVRTGESELLSMKYSDINWKQSSIRVFAKKTNSYRVLPLKPEFLEKLKEKQKTSESGFLVEYKGRPVKSLGNSFRRVRRKLKLNEKIVLYDLRHWYCTSLLSGGAPVNTVAQLMGHSSAKMTLDVYGHVIPGDTAKALQYLPDIG